MFKICRTVFQKKFVHMSDNFYVARNFNLKFVSALSTRNQWEKPEGFDTGIKVYNELLREKVPLILTNEGIATWYACGPTVYADAHIGHASCYVKFDIIRRILTHMFDIDVIMLMGITDIDDKIIKKANEENCTIQEVSNTFTTRFLYDLDCLNVQRPTVLTYVTEFIPDIISFCDVLLAKGYAYVTTEGNVYFIVSKEASEIPDEQQTTTEFSPVIDPLKKDSRDFALWKAAKAGEPSWLSPWGYGRPGWHIECSTMGSSMFGSKIDIHTGGSDLRFPHHSNENVQCCAYHGNQQWVNYWMHSGLLQYKEDVKMSKSLGNTINVQTFLKEHDANVFRIMCLQSHYSNDIQYSDETLELATNIYLKLHNSLNDAELYISGDLQCRNVNSEFLFSELIRTRKKIKQALADDFCSSLALKHILHLVSEMNKCLQPSDTIDRNKNIGVIATVSNYVDKVLEMLGVCIINKRKLPVYYNCIVCALVKFRQHVRQYALNVKLNRSPDGQTEMKNTEIYSHDTRDQNLNPLQQQMVILEKTLNSYGITFNRDTGWSANDLLSNNDSENFQFHYLLKNTDAMFDALWVFYKVVQLYSCTDGAVPKKSIKNSSLKDIMIENNESLSRKTLLKASDDFRLALSHVAIGIKDFRKSSIWFPLAMSDSCKFT